jgi:hypothetical protein
MLEPVFYLGGVVRRLAAKEIRFEEIRGSETKGDQAARVRPDV